MTSAQDLIARVYAAFNRRDIDAALALMSDTVSWPKASEGGRVVGKQEIRQYWTRQWMEFNPVVEPIEIAENGGGLIEVRVHQVVRSMRGDLLSDSEVGHNFTLANGLIERMDLRDDGGSASPSAAFAKRSAPSA